MEKGWFITILIFALFCCSKCILKSSTRGSGIYINYFAEQYPVLCMLNEDHLQIAITGIHANYTTVANLSALIKAGILADLNMSPKLDDNLINVVQNIFKHVPAQKFNMLWVNFFDISDYPTCEWVQQFVKAIRTKGKNVGIVADKNSWIRTFGNQFACKQVSNLPLMLQTSVSRQFFGGWIQATLQRNIHDQDDCCFFDCIPIALNL